LAAISVHGAKPPPQRFFHSSGGAIECELDNSAAIGVRAYCQTQTPPRSVTLSANGKLKHCTGDGCIGNGPTNATTLKPGHVATLGPFTCKAGARAISCTLRDGKGFSISVAGVKTL
jgi:hypothetical protein